MSNFKIHIPPGLLIAGPLNHLLYEIMGKLLAGKPAKQAKIGQLLFSNFIISPTMNSSK